MVSSLRAFSIFVESIESCFFPAFLRPSFRVETAVLSEDLATSLSLVHAWPKADMSSSNSPLLFPNFAKASSMFLVPLAASDMAVNGARAAVSFSLLSSSAILAFSSRVRFFAFSLLRATNLSARVLDLFSRASIAPTTSPDSIPNAALNLKFKSLLSRADMFSKLALISSALLPASPRVLACCIRPLLNCFIFLLLLSISPFHISCVKPALAAALATNAKVCASASRKPVVELRAPKSFPPSTPTF